MTTKIRNSPKERTRALPRLADVLAEKTADPQFAKLMGEEMAALRLGIALCEARERCQLTQQDIETRAGIPQETLSRIERGRMPSLATLQKIAKALGVQVTVRPDDTVTVEPFAAQRAA
jgi:DNA-binding XRE family transcriptional regulator